MAVGEISSVEVLEEGCKGGGLALTACFFNGADGAGGRGFETESDVFPVECLDLKNVVRSLEAGILEVAVLVGILETTGWSTSGRLEACFDSTFAREEAVDEESRENKSETLVLRFTGVGRGMLDWRFGAGEFVCCN